MHTEATVCLCGRGPKAEVIRQQMGHSGNNGGLITVSRRLRDTWNGGELGKEEVKAKYYQG